MHFVLYTFKNLLGFREPQEFRIVVMILLNLFNSSSTITYNRS